MLVSRDQVDWSLAQLVVFKGLVELVCPAFAVNMVANLIPKHGAKSDGSFLAIAAFFNSKAHHVEDQLIKRFWDWGFESDGKINRFIIGASLIGQDRPLLTQVLFLQWFWWWWLPSIFCHTRVVCLDEEM